MYNKSTGYRVFQVINGIIMTFIVAICLYPFLYTLAISLSNRDAVLLSKVFIIPVGFNLDSYNTIIHYPLFWSGYLNTIIYTSLGTLIAMIMTIMCAYPLSKKDLFGRSVIMKFIVFTMFFSGGLVPYYILVRSLGFVDKIWAIVIPGAISTWNMILLMTFFRSIPESLEESAAIDGMNYIGILIRIVLPLSKPSLATISLFYAVGFWNDWFSSFLFMNSNERYPIMLVLRNIISGADIAARQNQGSADILKNVNFISATVKAASIMLSTLPILMMYPFLQKYFIKGAMIGSLKG